MKKFLIRRGVFETNSSSAHSVSLAGTDKEFIFDTISPDENGKITLNGGEFGWEWFKHNDALTKANYAAVAHKNNPDLVREVIMEQTGCDEVVFNFSDDYDHPNWSYIDHDSVGVCPSTKEELRDFIFNKNSWLFGGNDNTTPHPNFYDVPLIKANGITERPQYKYKLTINSNNDELDFVTLFKKLPNEEEFENAFRGLFDHGVVVDRNGNFLFTNSYSSDSDLFEFSSWKVKPDLENKIVYFIHRGTHKITHEIFRKRYGRKYNPYDDTNPSRRDDFKLLDDIENELYETKDERVVKGIKFELHEI